MFSVTGMGYGRTTPRSTNTSTKGCVRDVVKGLQYHPRQQSFPDDTSFEGEFADVRAMSMTEPTFQNSSGWIWLNRAELKEMSIHRRKRNLSGCAHSSESAASHRAYHSSKSYAKSDRSHHHILFFESINLIHDLLSFVNKNMRRFLAGGHLFLSQVVLDVSHAWKHDKN